MKNKRTIETTDFLKMVSRLIRRAGKRVGDADERELKQLSGLRKEIDDAIRAAIRGQLSSGRSWDHIGQALGITRQGAYRRYGREEKQMYLLDL